MRISPCLRTAALSAAAAGMLTVLGVVRPAAAQEGSSPAPVAAVRGGVYFPFNSRIKQVVGKTFYGGGIDYIVHQQPGLSRTEVSVDYIERSSGNHTARIIPVTVGQFTLQGAHGGMRPYLGLGAGAYFIHQTGPNDVGINEKTDKTAIGGYVGAGIDLSGSLMVEARYHLIQKVGLYNSSGLQVMAGFRF